MPNPTGTPAAIRPDGSTLKPGPAPAHGRRLTRPGIPVPEARRLHSAAVDKQSAGHGRHRLGSRGGKARKAEAGARRRDDGCIRRACRAHYALADKISHPIAIFDGLDKITGRIISFEVGINETVQFGALQITPRVCYSRPPTDPPQTDAFAQVDEIDEQKQLKRIFSGWMFADSPGLHGIEHPIFDIWLTGCKGGTMVIHEAPAPEVDASAPNPTKLRRPISALIQTRRSSRRPGSRRRRNPSLSRLSLRRPSR